MIDLNKVKFITTKDGIRGAINIEKDNFTAHSWAVVYIHKI